VKRENLDIDTLSIYVFFFYLEMDRISGLCTEPGTLYIRTLNPIYDHRYPAGYGIWFPTERKIKGQMSVPFLRLTLMCKVKTIDVIYVFTNVIMCLKKCPRKLLYVKNIIRIFWRVYLTKNAVKYIVIKSIRTIYL